MFLFWKRCFIFKKITKQSQFALFVATLKNLTSNQMKNSPITYYFKILLANELLSLAKNFTQIYNLDIIKNLLPPPSFTKIQNKPGYI